MLSLLQNFDSDSSMYASAKSSDTKNSDDASYGPAFLFDGVVDNSGSANNWITQSNAVHPWAEIAFTEAVDIKAIEFTTYGAENVLNFKNIDIRAGLNGTSLAHHGPSDNLITDNPVHAHYIGPNTLGQVVYVTFSKPIKTQFLLIQAVNLNSHLMLAELKVIECKYRHLFNRFH